MPISMSISIFQQDTCLLTKGCSSHSPRSIDDLEAQRLSLVVIFGQGRYQKNFEAKLVGADKTKDLAVLDVCHLSRLQCHGCYIQSSTYNGLGLRMVTRKLTL